MSVAELGAGWHGGGLGGIVLAGGFEMKAYRSLVVAAALVAGVSGSACGGTLYSGLGLPTAEGWSYQAVTVSGQTITPWGGSVVTPLAIGVMVDSTSDLLGYAGYSRQLPAGALNRNDGFVLSFTSALLAENNSNTPRAGLSVTVLTSDSKGVEFAFRPTSIFAQNATFSSTANSVAFDTSVLTTYHLAVSGTTYSLYTDSTPLLSGSLLNYTVSSNPLTFVYGSTDLIAISDNTSQASGRFQLTNVTVVPEPTSAVFGLLGLALPLLGRRR